MSDEQERTETQERVEALEAIAKEFVDAYDMLIQAELNQKHDVQEKCRELLNGTRDKARELLESG